MVWCKRNYVYLKMCMQVQMLAFDFYALHFGKAEKPCPKVGGLNPNTHGLQPLSILSRDRPV